MQNCLCFLEDWIIVRDTFFTQQNSLVENVLILDHIKLGTFRTV